MHNSTKTYAIAGNDKDRYSLLLAEDDVYDQELIIEIVGQIDKRWKVSRTSNGLQALLYLESLPESRFPDLILLDYKMPLMTGEEVLARLAEQEKYKAIPKAVLTTSPPGVEKQRCLAYGAMHYLVKPERASEMKAVLMWLLGSLA
jgi:CheY-like chemotaxis protein